MFEWGVTARQLQSVRVANNKNGSLKQELNSLCGVEKEDYSEYNTVEGKAKDNPGRKVSVTKIWERLFDKVLKNHDSLYFRDSQQSAKINWFG